MNIVIFGFIFQATMMNNSFRSRSMNNVVLKQSFTRRNIIIKPVSTTEVRPSVSYKIIINSGVGVTNLLRDLLRASVTVGHGAGLDAAKVADDTDSKIMDIIVLNILSIIIVSLNYVKELIES